MLNNVLGVLSTPTPPVTNSYESIATTVVGSGGQSTITFSVIPSTYKHLQIRYIARATSGSVVNFFMNYNGDSGSNYTRHAVYGDGSSPYALGSASQTSMFAGVVNSNADTFCAGVIDILDYKDTNKYKTMRNLNGADWNGSGYAVLYSGLWMNTSAINEVSFSGITFAQYSSFALYGIKG